VRSKVACGAAIDAEDKDGNTPLMLAGEPVLLLLSLFLL
jgi:hypothetical protein